MSYKVLSTTNFGKQVKQLVKKYPSLVSDLKKLKLLLEANPRAGISLGKDCYKVRIRISSKGKGKSGGGRVITYAKIKSQTIYLLAIYDKAERETLSIKELQYLLDIFSSELL